jgi:hypothetical protein
LVCGGFAFAGSFRFPIFISSCHFGGVFNIRSASCRVDSSKFGFFDMAHKFTIRKEVLATALAEFQQFFGHSMQQWSKLERSLCDWFQHITGMKDSMARAIFYSARGFMARIEMLESAIEHTDRLSPHELEFLTAAIKKSSQYAGFRNKIVHGEPRPHYNIAEHLASYEIVDGADVTGQGKFISVDDLKRAALRIHTLHTCISHMHPWLRERNQNLKSPEECLAQVRALPNEASANTDGPTPEASSRPAQGPVHRNKKEHRAAQKAARRPESR